MRRSAPAFFTRQIQSNPRDSFAYAMRAIASLALKPDWKTAMADLNEAVRLSPSDAFARGSRGVASLAQGDVARAQADLDEAIRLDPRNPAYVIDRAAAWRHRREYDKAIADCDAALRLDRARSPRWSCAFDPFGAEGIRRRDCGLQRGDPPRPDGPARLSRPRGRSGRER